jgi:hypothetical protein
MGSRGVGSVEDIYQTLDTSNKQIRVISVQGSTIPATEPVVCQLTYISLAEEEHPRYETISYTWGDSHQSSAIVLNGYVFEVPCSTEMALHRLRYSTCDRERLLWIDFACINQSNLAERGAQVAMQADIYNLASCNLVYIGEDFGEAEQSFQDIRVINEEIRAETDNFRSLLSTLTTISDDESSNLTNGFLNYRLRLSSKKLNCTIDAESLTSLFSRPWFSRVWVIQEAALASKNICHCGDFSIDLEDVLRAITWLDHKHLHIDRRLVYCQRMRSARDLWYLVDHEHGWFYTPSRGNKVPDLPYLTNLSSRFDATDPRDKLYAIIGLAERSSEMIHPLIRPDYSKSVVQVFRDGARYIAEELGNIEFLGSISYRSLLEAPKEDFNSWVPRWHRSRIVGLDPVPLSEKFNACGSMGNVRICKSRDPDILALQGIVSGRILHTCKIRNEDTDSLWKGLENIEQFTVAAHKGNISQTSCQELIARTLIAGINAGRNLATGQDTEDYLSYHRYIHKHSTLPPPQREITKETDEQTRAASRFRYAFDQATPHRHFFVTEDGNIGLCPRTASRGDMIVILYGGAWPYVLRKVPSTPFNTSYHFDGPLYELHGACYLEGSMFGETMDNHIRSGRRARTFGLR